MLCRSLLVIAGICVSHAAAAVCYYDGRAYPTGAQVGNYVCQADGTWRRVGRYPNVETSPTIHAAGASSETARPAASAAGNRAAYEYFACRSDLSQTSL